MAEQTYDQQFNGYWREPNKAGIPAMSGIYCVYECSYNLIDKSVFLHRLIYIGESDNINARIANHEKLALWQTNVRAGNELCYSFTAIHAFDRFRVEAALINYHQPPVNTQYKTSFPFEKTIVQTSDRNALLERFFVVNRH